MARQPSLLRPLALALDVGTSSVRAIIYDSRLKPVPGAEAHQPYQPRVTRDGGAELNPRVLLSNVRAVIDRALAGVPDQEIAAVGISSFWHGLLATDADRNPLTPIYLWSDQRSWREAGRLRERLDELRVHHRTGCRLHPSYWPAKIAWLRRTDRRLRAKGVRWHSPTDLLFANGATSDSLASGTGLRLLRRRGWDRDLLETVGIEEASLPCIEEHPQLPRRRWRQLANAHWAPPIGDGALANVGSGCLNHRRRALTIGTSGALRVLVAEPPKRLPPSLWCYRSTGTTFVLGGALSNGGNLHHWALQVLNNPETRSMANPVDHGLTFLPLLAGERGPDYALHATGAIAGLTSATTAADILQAGLEGVTLDFARLDRDLDRVTPAPEVLVASGAGLLANPAWMQMIASATGRPVAAGNALEASARGAACAAFTAAGIPFDNPDPGYQTPVRPDPRTGDYYSRAAARRDALYRVLVKEQGK